MDTLVSNVVTLRKVNIDFNNGKKYNTLSLKIAFLYYEIFTTVPALSVTFCM